MERIPHNIKALETEAKKRGISTDTYLRCLEIGVAMVDISQIWRNGRRAIILAQPTVESRKAMRRFVEETGDYIT